jgi:hypothetical protein
MAGHLQSWKRTLASVDRSVLAIDRAIVRVWRGLRELLANPRDYISNYRRALELLSQIPALLVQAFVTEFKRLYKIGYLRARQLLLRSLALRTTESRSSLQEQGSVSLQIGPHQKLQIANLAADLRGDQLTKTKAIAV